MLNPAGNSFPWLLAPLLLTQGLWARARTLRMPEAAGERTGSSGSGHRLHLVALGDSIIAGVGVDTTRQALPARLACALADALDLEVRWSAYGRNGARTRDLLTWPVDTEWKEANLVLVSNGLNDVTGLMAMQPWLEEKAALYERLRNVAPGALIVQLGLPPLGHFPALPQPLRVVLGRRAEAFDRALGTLLQGLRHTAFLPFRSVPEPHLFAADGYHPGPEAIDIWARSLAGQLLPLLAKES